MGSIRFSGSMAATDRSFSMDQLSGEGLAGKYTRIRLMEPLITMDIGDMAEELGTVLEGLEFSVEEPKRILRAIEWDKSYYIHHHIAWDEETSPQKVLMRLRDVIRYTETCESDDLYKTARNTIDFLNEKGYIYIAVRNGFESPNTYTGNGGIYLYFISPFGPKVELLVHPRQSADSHRETDALRRNIIVAALAPDKKQASETETGFNRKNSAPEGYDVLRTYTLGDEDYRSSLEESRWSLTEVTCETAQNAMVYAVSLDGTELLSGYEALFSDGSMRLYRNYKKAGKAALLLTNEKGAEIDVKEISPAEYSIEDVLGEIRRLEEEQAAFMSRHFPHGELPD